MSKLRDAIAALVGAKQSLADFNRQIESRRKQMEELEAIPPHTDDLVEWARRGLEYSSQQFLEDLGWYWNDRTLGKHVGSWFATDSGPVVLGVPLGTPSAGYDSVRIRNREAHSRPPCSFDALTHFLKPAIEKELPKLIEQCFPSARKGMRWEERSAKLEKLRAEIEQLEADRDELARQLSEAQASAQ